jgi:hypothetical protein
MRNEGEMAGPFENDHPLAGAYSLAASRSVDRDDDRRRIVFTV